MGSRANIIVINQERRFQLYQCHWCANTLPRDLFWGPGHALRFIGQQEHARSVEFLDARWAEGGAVLDMSGQALLMFGGEDLTYDPPLRRIYLQMLALVWKGWDVRWAHHQNLDIAGYAGITRELAMAGYADPPPAGAMRVADEGSWVETICTVQADDGAMRAFPLTEGFIECMLNGPALIDMLGALEGYPLYTLDCAGSFPRGGMHIDVPGRRVSLWWARGYVPVDRILALWNGWDVRMRNDAYEEHLELAAGCLAALVPDHVEYHRRLREYLLVEPRPTGSRTVVDIMADGLLKGHDVEVNHAALREPLQDVELTERWRILDMATMDWWMKYRATRT